MEDFDGWAAFIADEEAGKFLGGAQVRSVAWRHFTACVGSWALQGFAMFSVIERSTGSWVGRLGPIHPEGWPGDEVGWGIARAVWGKGYATEGATAAMDWAFEGLGWERAIHTIDPQNRASQIVAERLGSKLIGPGELPPPYHESTVEIWGQSREEWRARRTFLSP